MVDVRDKSRGTKFDNPGHRTEGQSGTDKSHGRTRNRSTFRTKLLVPIVQCRKGTVDAARAIRRFFLLALVTAVR
jgi:hypothetical protein